MTRRTSNAPLLLLVASLALIGVAAGVAVVTAWKSRANTRQLLGDYAAFAGWSYQQHLMEEFGTTLWSTVADRFDPIARMLDAAAPAVAGLSRRLAATPALANLAAVSREQFGDAYCGGQIERSLRRVAGG